MPIRWGFLHRVNFVVPWRPTRGRRATMRKVNTICLVSCVGGKRPTPSPARDLYQSDWFPKARCYVEAIGCAWFILSAKHGLIHPDDVISPYEQTLTTMGMA